MKLKLRSSLYIVLNLGFPNMHEEIIYTKLIYLDPM